MTGNPRTIGPDKLAAEAVEIMERNKVNQRSSSIAIAAPGRAQYARSLSRKVI